MLRPYKGNLVELYRDKDPNGVYEELKKIIRRVRGVGPKTASLMMIELERMFKLGLPTGLEPTNEIVKGLKRIGLDLDDFEEKYIPIVDVYGWLLVRERGWEGG